MRKNLLILFLFLLFYGYSIICIASDNNNHVTLNFLFKPGCLKCIKIEKQLGRLKDQYPSLVIKRYNINDTDNFEFIVNLMEKYSVPEDKGFLVPAVFIENNYYIQNDIDIHKITKCLKSDSVNTKPGFNFISNNNKHAPQDTGTSNKFIIKIDSIPYTTVFFAGLVDGVNPCSFALLIFFLSYLKIAGRKQNQLIKVGLAYSLSVFSTYMLIGLGFFHGVNAVISQYSMVAFSLYFFSGILALLFSLLTA